VRRDRWDAVVVGAGPNGLAAAADVALAGRSVLVLEARESIGGGCRTEELTEPGFRHDVCSAIHPLAVASPCFRELDLDVEWIEPDVALAHPLDDQPPVLLSRSIEESAAGLGRDEPEYARLARRWTAGIDDLFRLFAGDVRALLRSDLLARMGVDAVRSVGRLPAKGVRARALLAGMAAHSILPLERSPTAGVALTLGALAHTTGWPVARGGSSNIAAALAAIVRDCGGEIRTDAPVRSVRDLPARRALILDLTPRQLLRVDGLRFPPRYERALRRYRYGPGACKVDYALDGPVPWTHADCARAGTIHLGGTFEEIAAAEAAVWRGEHPERPFVLVAQQSLVDPTRAPAGKLTLWAYTHVPNGSPVDMTAAVEAQLERFAPGFRELVIARRTRTAADLEGDNENDVGGDINAGVLDLRQLWTRPARRVSPHTTPIPGVFLASASTPPGGGVHGMCGHVAARAALRYLRSEPAPGPGRSAPGTQAR
jgi:phytoene dehydrogenase-like protein